MKRNNKRNDVFVGGNEDKPFPPTTSKLQRLVDKVSSVVGESLAYTICNLLKCNREDLHNQDITNEQLHLWYKIMMYQLQQYHWRNESSILQLEQLIKEFNDVERLK